MIRRSFLRCLAVLLLAAAAVPSNAGAAGARLKIMIKSAWGSDDPTKGAFPFLHGDALSEAGHEVQIFLLGEAVSLMRKSMANAVVPVRWPQLSEALSKISAKKIPIYACGACSRSFEVWSLAQTHCFADAFHHLARDFVRPGRAFFENAVNI